MITAIAVDLGDPHADRNARRAAAQHHTDDAARNWISETLDVYAIEFKGLDGGFDAGRPVGYEVRVAVNEALDTIHSALAVLREAVTDDTVYCPADEIERWAAGLTTTVTRAHLSLVSR